MSPLRSSPLILPLLLLGAGVFMLLSALVLEPAAGGHGEAAGAEVVDDHGAAADEHGTGDAAAVDDHAADPAGAATADHGEAAASGEHGDVPATGDHGDEHAGDATAAADDAHADEAAGAAADDHAAENDGHATAVTGHEDTAAAEDHGAAGATADDHGDEHPEEASGGSFLGIDLDEVNMASPRLALVAIALSLLLGVVLLVRRDWLVMIVVAVVSVALALFEFRETLRAGDELGIVVPLTALAVVLHLAAAALAVLALQARRAPAERGAPATTDHESALPAHGRPA